MTTRQVVGTWTDPTGQPLSGQVWFTPVTRLAAPPVIVLPIPQRIELDSAGGIAVELMTTGTGQPSGWVWQITERVGNTHLSWLFDLPDDPAPLDLSTVTPIDTVGELVYAQPPAPVMASPWGPQTPVASGGGGGVVRPQPLGWLSDVIAPADTPAGNVLGTSGEGVWEPLPLAYIEEQIVTPLQQEIGNAATVAVHTDLVGYIGEVSDRVAALEGTEETVTAAEHLTVDKYSGSFITVRVGSLSTWPTTIDVALATVPGVNGEVYPDLAAIAGGAAVYVDFAGTLGRLYTAQGAGVYGSTLKEWIRKGSILTVHRDDTDPAHPQLVVDQVTEPTATGSSLDARYIKIDVLKQVVAASADFPAFKAAISQL